MPSQVCLIVYKEIENLLIKGVIKPSCHEAGEFISPSFLRPKPDGTYWMIPNLRYFNEFVQYYRSRFHLCWCIFYQLEFNLFCLPTFQSDPKVCTKNYARQGKGNITDSCVANTDLVSTCSLTAPQPNLDLQAITKSVTACSLQGATSTIHSCSGS